MKTFTVAKFSMNVCPILKTEDKSGKFVTDVDGAEQYVREKYCKEGSVN